MSAINAQNPVTALKLLKKKGRASAADIGADKALMEFLTAEGFVKAEGTIKTGKRGRPPVAFVPAFEYDPKDAPQLPEEEPRKTSAAISQDQIDKVLIEVANDYASSNCSCVVPAGIGQTPADIRALNCGCTNPHYVCPALDAVRRRANLVGVNS